MKSFFCLLGAFVVGSFAVGGCSSGADDGGPADPSTEEDIKSTTQCKGLLPQNCRVCDDGTSACAHWVVKNKQCVIETCPEPAPITDPSQCHGALPHSCQFCDNGKPSCAHWAVKNGACEVETCAPTVVECVTASDCQGVLPHIAKICPDGKTHSVSHVCTPAGKCDIQICPE